VDFTKYDLVDVEEGGLAGAAVAGADFFSMMCLIKYNEGRGKTPALVTVIY